MFESHVRLLANPLHTDDILRALSLPTFWWLTMHIVTEPNSFTLINRHTGSRLFQCLPASGSSSSCSLASSSSHLANSMFVTKRTLLYSIPSVLGLPRYLSSSKLILVWISLMLAEKCMIQGFSLSNYSLSLFRTCVHLVMQRAAHEIGQTWHHWHTDLHFSVFVYTI